MRDRPPTTWSYASPAPSRISLRSMRATCSHLYGYPVRPCLCQMGKRQVILALHFLQARGGPFESLSTLATLI